MKLKPILFIAAGLLLVGWAATRVWSEIIPAFQPTSTPDETILESFAPNTGPLAGTGTAGDIESQPVTGTQAPPAPAATGMAQIASLEAPPAQATQAPASGASPKETMPAGTPAPLPTGDLAASGDQFFAPDVPTPTPYGSAPQGSATAPPTVVPQPIYIPDRIVIPVLGLDAPVTLAASQKVKVAGQVMYQWLAPDAFAAGWHTSSAYLGMPGNTVLDGHHNIFGKVFGGLVNLNNGDKIDVYSQGKVWHWVVTNKMILQEAGVPVAQRLENARWIGRSDDTRLTLITCWPAESNTHRLIIVAVPDPQGFGGE